MKAETKTSKNAAVHPLQQDIFRSYLLLIIVMTVLTAATGSLMNISAERRKRDENLQNVAESIACSQLLTRGDMGNGEMLGEYLDSLIGSLSDVDVISVISSDNIRLYHSTHSLIGSVYDGTLPDFESEENGYYAENSVGPSGSQRRAYAAIYGSDGSYRGFVLAVTLMTNIRAETLRTLGLYALVAACVILLSLLLSARLSRKIKAGLMGHEPDDFSAMYRIRDNILAALDEGIVAVDRSGKVQFANPAASEMLGYKGADLSGISMEKLYCRDILAPALERGEKLQSVQGGEGREGNILFDTNPIRDGSEIVGAVGILHDRTEYTKLMEDLAGTRYLVDSMRANNHDFTNKLHVILGLIQMEMYDQAKSYIENISIVQRETISQIMRNVDEPSVAALLVGKIARASEVNVKFVLRENFRYFAADLSLPAGALVTILGNLIDNALDAMNMMDASYDTQRTLLFGIFSRPGSLLITVEDNGPGISEEMRERIFENGFSTKGEGRGTGLYHTKKLIEGLGGTIVLESTVGKGSVFTVSFDKKE